MHFKIVLGPPLLEKMYVTVWFNKHFLTIILKTEKGCFWRKPSTLTLHKYIYIYKVDWISCTHITGSRCPDFRYRHMDCVVQQNYKPMSVYKKRYFLHSAHRAYGGFRTKRTRRDVTRWASRERCKYRVCVDGPLLPPSRNRCTPVRGEQTDRALVFIEEKKVSDNGFSDKCVVAKTVEFLLRDSYPPSLCFTWRRGRDTERSCPSKGAADGIWIMTVTGHVRRDHVRYEPE